MNVSHMGHPPSNAHDIKVYGNGHMLPILQRNTMDDHNAARHNLVENRFTDLSANENKRKSFK